MPIYNVTMQATINKSFTVVADDEDAACEEANETFNPLHSPDEYEDEIVAVELMEKD